MRVELVVLVRMTPENQERLNWINHDISWSRRNGTDFLECRIPANSDDAKRLLDELQGSELEYYMREERHYDRAEIRRARILKTCPEPLVLGSLLPTEVEFDWSQACETCMRSPEQVGPLVIDHKRLQGEAAILGPRHELIVNERIALRMIRDGITGCILREVETPDGQDSPDMPYFQVIVTNELPRAFSPPTRFISTSDRCEDCGQGGLFLDSPLYYDLPEDDFTDINYTRETFGQGAAIGPEILLSARFYNLMLACGASLEEAEPVLFV